LDRVGPLVALKLRLMLRMGKGAWPVVAWVLWLLAFVLPLGFLGVAFTSVGFWTLDITGDRELLHFTLFAVWIFWLLFPLIGFSLNQSYDLTKLFIYPVSRATIFLGATLACFLDPSLLIVLPTFAVIAYFYSTSIAAVAITIVALVVFLAQTLALSQAILWALLNVLRSRRARDWAMLLAPLIALSAYLAPNLYLRAATPRDPYTMLLAWAPSSYLHFTPAGVAARAIEAAASAHWTRCAAYLGASVGYLLAALGAGTVVLSRLHSGESGASRARERAREPAREFTPLQRLATTPLAALAVKEARYYWREPRYRSLFIGPVFPLIFVVGGSLSRSHGGPGLSPPIAILFVAVLALFGFSSLFQNVFGIDREGLRLLFVTPCPRSDILVGKNIAAIGVAWAASALAVLVAGFILHNPCLAATCIPFLLAAAIVLAAIGNVVSIHFPIRIARRGENPFASSSSRGCVNGLIGTLAFQVALLVAVPVVIAAAAPIVLRNPLAHAFCVPLALLYALAVYVGVLRFYSAPALERREMDILEECLAGEPVG